MAHLNPISLNELKDNATNCRVKRHLISTRTHEHGRPAETRPATAFNTHHPKPKQSSHPTYRSKVTNYV